MNHYILGLELKRTKTKSLEIFIILFCKKCIKTFVRAHIYKKILVLPSNNEIPMLFKPC
jgi:hypothetical protein